MTDRRSWIERVRGVSADPGEVAAVRNAIHDLLPMESRELAEVIALYAVTEGLAYRARHGAGYPPEKRGEHKGRDSLSLESAPPARP